MPLHPLDPKWLHAFREHQKDPQKILAIFREAGLDAPRLSSINPAPDPVTPYSRVVFSAAPECEIMLARWTPDRECAPHDHGASAGWVFYLEGNFVEESYRWQDGELISAGSHAHRAGTHTEVRKDEIHSCKCDGQGLSLHIYFPRIERMRVYDPEGRRTITVSDDCGAWIPDRPEQRVAETPWVR
jgi:cysteine dioxygenase